MAGELKQDPVEVRPAKSISDSATVETAGEDCREQPPPRTAEKELRADEAVAAVIVVTPAGRRLSPPFLIGVEEGEGATRDPATAPMECDRRTPRFAPETSSSGEPKRGLACETSWLWVETRRFSWQERVKSRARARPA